MQEKQVEIGTLVEMVREFTGKNGEASYRVGDSSVMLESSNALL